MTRATGVGGASAGRSRITSRARSKPTTAVSPPSRE